jgi:glutathione synthase/RimK-type ligase-like ATP-grasp enzyme
MEFGEITLMLFGGKYTHAVKKVAKPGDFRVQDDHGGKVYRYEPTSEEIAFAERAVHACPHLPVYARVDLVRNEQQQLVVMEFEMIEPELWLRFHPPSATSFATAIVQRLTA